MENYENENNANLAEIAVDILARLNEIAEMLKNKHAEKDVIVENFLLDRDQVLKILGVSVSTLARWRMNNQIPYKLQKNGTTVYVFRELLESLKRGDFAARGFDRTAALQRMQDFYRGRYSALSIDAL